MTEICTANSYQINGRYFNLNGVACKQPEAENNKSASGPKTDVTAGRQNSQEERAWWQILLFGSRTPASNIGCGSQLIRRLNENPKGDTGVMGGDTDNDYCNNSPSAFNVVTPACGSSSIGLTPTLDWSDSFDADSGDTISYHLIVANNEDLNSPLFDATNIQTSTFAIPIPLQNGMTYYWQVIATDSCGQTKETAVCNFTTIEYCATPPSDFSLASPATGSTDVSLTPAFTWEAATDSDTGDLVQYDLELDTVDTFTNNPIVFSSINGTSFTIPAVNALSNDTTYHWRVKAFDGCGNEVYSQEVNSFTTAPSCFTPPDAFSLTAPADSAIDVSVTPAFDWANSIDTDPGDTVSYRLEIDTDTSFSAPATFTTSSSNYNITVPDALEFDTQYFWRVIAVDGCDNEVASTQTFSFTTLQACATPPNNFSLSTPADGTLNASITPTFDWADATDPDAGDTLTYRVEIDTNNAFPSPATFLTSSSTYSLPLANRLNFNTTYYWRVITIDDCGNEMASTQTYSLTTRSCTSRQIQETDFIENSETSSTDIDSLTTAGSIILEKDWTNCWHASSGVVPQNATPAWTLTDPAGSNPLIVTDVTSRPALHLNSIGTNAELNYCLDTTFDNTVGGLVRTRFRMYANEGFDVLNGAASHIFIDDGTYRNRVLLLTDHIAQIPPAGSPLNYPSDYPTSSIDTTLTYHSITTEWLNQDLQIYYDGSSIINAPGRLATAASGNEICFWDTRDTEDAEGFFYDICYTNQGTTVNFLSSGQWNGTIHSYSATATNPTFSSNSNLPTNTSISFETRSGNTATPDGTWSSWTALSGSDIQSPARQYLQIRPTLSTDDTTTTPRLDDYTINYCD